MKKLSTALGWGGTVLIILAYFLLSFSVVSVGSLLYQSLNLFGALVIIIDTYFKKDTPPEVLNIIWAIIALVSIVRILVTQI